MDQLLGVLLLGAYVLGVVGTAAAVTYAVIKIFPTERTPKKPSEPGTGEEPRDGEPRGRLYRRARRGTT
ncbi:MAG TPA: hypothetical protein VNJ53_06005 [Gaiellaceae bacterium]|nr:hypothetical protein [Gaiellaceae bacterium]